MSYYQISCNSPVVVFFISKICVFIYMYTHIMFHIKSVGTFVTYPNVKFCIPVYEGLLIVAIKQ
jgi:hypothetical protein